VQLTTIRILPAWSRRGRRYRSPFAGGSGTCCREPIPGPQGLAGAVRGADDRLSADSNSARPGGDVLTLPAVDDRVALDRSRERGYFRVALSLSRTGRCSPLLPGRFCFVLGSPTAARLGDCAVLLLLTGQLMHVKQKAVTSAEVIARLSHAADRPKRPTTFREGVKAAHSGDGAAMPDPSATAARRPNCCLRTERQPLPRSIDCSIVFAPNDGRRRSNDRRRNDWCACWRT
jgi:hypothetical protein